MMNTDAMRQSFWSIIFVAAFCVATPKILRADNSCPCRPSNECTADSLRLARNSKILILPCEDDDLIRCCSPFSRPIEWNPGSNESLQNIDGTGEIDRRSKVEDTSGESMVFTENLMSDVTHADESFEEYSTTESPTTEARLQEISSISLSPTTATGPGVINANAKETANGSYARNADTANTSETTVTPTSAKRVQEQVPPQRPYQFGPWRKFVEPRPIRVRIRGNVNTQTSTIPPVLRFTQSTSRIKEEKGIEKVPGISFDTDEEKLIQQAIRFESRRIAKISSPKKRFASFAIEETSSGRHEKSEGKFRKLFPRKAILDNNYGPEFLSAPKRVVQKMSDLSKQKISAETSLTPDRISTQAMNENAKPSSKLRRLRDGNTSIRD